MNRAFSPTANGSSLGQTNLTAISLTAQSGISDSISEVSASMLSTILSPPRTAGTISDLNGHPMNTSSIATVKKRYVAVSTFLKFLSSYFLLPSFVDTEALNPTKYKESFPTTHSSQISCASGTE